MSKDNKKPELFEEGVSEKILLRQMREEERRERVKGIIIQYKKQLISIAVAVIVIVIITTFLEVKKQNSQEKYSKLMHQILLHENNGEEKDALKLIKEINNSSSSPAHIKALTLVKHASKLVKENKIGPAVDSYLEANSIKSADPYIRELAGLLAVKSMIDSGDERFIKRIKATLPDLEKESKYLKPFLTEQKGLFYWYLGKKEESNKIFKDLAIDSSAPDYIKARAIEFSKITKN